MKTAILNIGTELLMGMTLNTNSEYLSKKLNEYGFSVLYHSVVGDNSERITEEIARLLEKNDLIVITGGLGPTQDDISKEVVADYFNLKMILNEEIKEKLIKRFEKYGRKITENNFRQAYFPKGSIILNNEYGTAPGCIVKEKDKIAVLLPGPPRELIPMFENYALKHIVSKKKITSKFIKLFGIGESSVEDKIYDLVINQTDPTIATYVNKSGVTIRVTTQGSSEEENLKKLSHTVSLIKKRLGEYIFTTEGEELIEVVVKKLLEKNLTISFAESCTGGLMAKMITDFSGVSKSFITSLVTYSNDSKIKELNVDKYTLNEYGAVSEEVALEMVDGLYNKYRTDICVSVTGIAGPTGATEEKPVGLVYIGIRFKNNIIIHKKNFRGDRERIRRSTAMFTFNEIRKFL